MVSGMLVAEAAAGPADNGTIAAEAPASSQEMVFLLLPDGRVVAAQRAAPGAVGPGEAGIRPSIPMVRTHGSR